MGVWIETFLFLTLSYGSTVTPCMGVWIETSKLLQLLGYGRSHPVWVCGLKLLLP